MEKVVIFLGLPGAGKGTQAKLLKEKFDYKYMGSGDLLRARKKVDDFTGNKIGSVIDKGGRVPTPVIARLWLEKFEKFKQEGFEGFIIDGSPRSLLEKTLIDKSLKWYEWDENAKIILVDISEQESIDRLTKRRNCQDCGRPIPYVGKFKEMEECPDCGGELVAREDDDEEGVKARLEWFKTDVQPVIDAFEEEGRLIKVNGNQSIEDVFKEVLEVLK